MRFTCSTVMETWALGNSPPHLLSPPCRYICVLTAPRCDCAVSSSADFSLDPSGNQREVRLASASSALLAGPAGLLLQALPLQGLVLCLQPPNPSKSFCPASHHSVSSHLGCGPSFHTLTSWSPLALNCLAGPSSWSVPIMDGPESPPCSLLSPSPLGSHVTNGS